MRTKMKMKLKIKFNIKKAAYIIIGLMFIGTVLIFGISFFEIKTTKERIISDEAAASLDKVDAIIILGAGVWEDNTPSPMLIDRLLKGIELYKSGASSKIIMSGDHGRTDYDEVNVMKQFAIDAGVPSKDIFMDHAGFSTYESMYRAREIFGAEKVIIVTQEYHMYRALYIASSMGMEVYGVPTEKITYGGELKRGMREIIARDKDFFASIFKPAPTYGGERILLSGSGDITNDRQ